MATGIDFDCPSSTASSRQPQPKPANFCVIWGIVTPNYSNSYVQDPFGPCFCSSRPYFCPCVVLDDAALNVPGFNFYVFWSHTTTQSMSLAADGASDELFFLLWAENEWPSSRPRQERHHHAQHAPASIPWYLPHTVVYKASSPCAWYFTSAKTSNILKKSKHNVLSRRIEEEFTKQTLAGDIVAHNPPEATHCLMCAQI